MVDVPIVYNVYLLTIFSLQMQYTLKLDIKDMLSQ